MNSGVQAKIIPRSRLPLGAKVMSRLSVEPWPGEQKYYKEQLLIQLDLKKYA